MFSFGKEEAINRKEKELDELRDNLTQVYDEQRAELERLSGLSSDEAKELLLKNIEDELHHEAAIMIRDIEAQTKEEADRKAREIIATAIQRYAADHVAETSVSVVALPNDEMKGRIIGREGRNIRALETLTGVDLIIDDTPEAVILSAFDPVRREVAKIALEKLINDGRIHPARIEEMVEKAQKEVDNIIKEEGEGAAIEVGVHGLNPDLIRLLGRLRFRSSFGQNVLKHSIEVAYLAAGMAAELRYLRHNVCCASTVKHHLGPCYREPVDLREGVHLHDHVHCYTAKSYNFDTHRQSLPFLNCLL
jgi:ribonuclease Y